MKIFSVFFVLLCSIISIGIEIDFSSGRYSLQQEERKGKEKYERRSSDEIYSKTQKEKEEAERRNSEPEEESVPPPSWKKIIVHNGGIVTNDFINTTSNRLVITVVNYAKEKKDGINDPKSPSDKYLLNVMLLPGDKYHIMNDGGNGVRMEKYLQAHKYCDEMTKQFSNYNKLYKKNRESGVPSFYEIYTATNITINSDYTNKTVKIVSEANDIDGDGILSYKEIMGKNGFVTDPTDFDTDHDGIPDKFDKNPLVKCQSIDPNIMPKEWCEYRSKGKKEKMNLLFPAKADPDNDGIINENEKILYTDPLKKDEKVICFPEHIVLTHYKSDIYAAYFNVYINYNKPVTLIVRSFDLDYDIPPEAPSLSYESSMPLGWKPSPLKKLFSQKRLPTKFFRIVAHVQPKTIYKFAVIDKGHKIKRLQTQNITVLAYSNERDEINGYDGTWIGRRSIEIHRLEDYSPWSDPAYWPYPPESAFPRADYIYKDFYKIKFKHEPFPEKHKGWCADTNDIIRIGVHPCTPTSIDKYDVATKNIIYGSNDFNKCKTKIISYKYLDAYFQFPCINSKYIPVFKEERVDENSEFVFKGKTVREIKEELNQRSGREVEIIEEGD